MSGFTPKSEGTFLIKAAIFDVDGTLVDSNVLHVEAWREAFSHYGKELTADEVHAQIGKGGDQLMPVFLPDEEAERVGPKSPFENGLAGGSECGGSSGCGPERAVAGWPRSPARPSVTRLT